MPVRVDAATALGAFVESEEALEKLRPNLSQLLSVLFEMITSAGNEETPAPLGPRRSPPRENQRPVSSFAASADGSRQRSKSIVCH